MSKAKISKKLQTQVKTRDGHTCRACGFGGDKKFAAHLVCDHAHSERNGGETSLENLQTLCGPCNTLKGSKNWTFPIREASKKWDLNYIWIARFLTTVANAQCSKTSNNPNGWRKPPDNLKANDMKTKKYEKLKTAKKLHFQKRGK